MTATIKYLAIPLVLFQMCFSCSALANCELSNFSPPTPMPTTGSASPSQLMAISPWLAHIRTTQTAPTPGLLMSSSFLAPTGLKNKNSPPPMVPPTTTSAGRLPSKAIQS